MHPAAADEGGIGRPTGVGAAGGDVIMSITLVLLDSQGQSTTRTVESGASVPIDPSIRVQVQVDGQVIDPRDIAREVNPPDVTLTLPDGQTVTLENFVNLEGGNPGGLTDADDVVVYAANLEGLTQPAAGPADLECPGGAS